MTFINNFDITIYGLNFIILLLDFLNNILYLY